MATFHISRDEAAKDFDGLILRASRGDEVFLEEDFRPLAVLRAAGGDQPRKLSEALRLAREHGSKVTLDGGFEADLNAVINSHLKPLIDPDDDPWAESWTRVS